MRFVRATLWTLGLFIAPAWAQVATPPAPSPGGPAAVMASSPEEAGKAAANLWRKRFPGLTGGRVALGWDVRVPAAASAAQGTAKADASLRPLPDLGVAAESLAQALDQVDPQTFSGVLWLEVVRGQNGEMTGLSLTHRAPGKAEVTRLDVTLDPPIRLSPIPTPASSAAEVLFRAKGAVCSAGLSDAGDEVWYTSGGRLVRRSLSRGEDLQEWPPADGNNPAGPCLVRLLSESDGAGKVGWWIGGRGAWFSRQGQEYRSGGTFDGFPLSERESKFLKAPWLPEEGAFLLQNHQGKELARFSELVRVRPEGGESLLVLLRKDGSVQALHGNSLEPLPSPAEGTFAAFAGWRDFVAMADAAAPYRVRVFKSGEGSTWEEIWASGPLSGRASALCLGHPKGRISVLAFVAGGDETLALLIPLP